MPNTTTMLAFQVHIGDRFLLEPEGCDPVEVELLAPWQWGLVHGWFEAPVLRLDTDERVIAQVHHKGEVQVLRDYREAT